MAKGRSDQIAAWLAENQPTPKVHEAFGVGWELPAQMPARLWFWYRSEFEAKKRNLSSATFAELDQVVELVPGLELLVQDSTEAGADRDAIYREVVAVLVGYLFPDLEPSGDEGKGRRSTSTGSSASTSGSSRRTSTGSTRSTSSRRSKKEPPGRGSSTA